MVYICRREPHSVCAGGGGVYVCYPYWHETYINDRLGLT